MSTAGTWPTSTFIVPYPRQFTVLPSAVRTPADFRFQKRHMASLTNVCEHLESINAVHSWPSTCTFMGGGSFLVFSQSGRKLMLMPPPFWRFPGQSDAIWSNESHDEPCATDCPVSLADPVSGPSPCGWDLHTCTRQIFYRHRAPMILKVFVWRRRQLILPGLRCQSWQLSLGSINVPHSSFPSRMRHVVDV